MKCTHTRTHLKGYTKSDKKKVSTIGMPASSKKKVSKPHCRLTKPCVKNSNRKLLVPNCMGADESR